MKYHYVYYSYEEWGRGYIGSRTSSCPPSEDTKYYGSFKDKAFCPTHKIILQEFNTRKEALEAEIALHDFYQVHINPHFANRAKQTSTKFTTFGVPISEGHRAKMRLATGGEKNPMYGTHRAGKQNPFYGKTHSESTRERWRKVRKGKNLGQENPFYGKTHSDETKQRLRDAKLGKKLSEEHRRKIGEGGKGKTHSVEAKAKMSRAKADYWRKKKAQTCV